MRVFNNLSVVTITKFTIWPRFTKIMEAKDLNNKYRYLHYFNIKRLEDTYPLFRQNSFPRSRRMIDQILHQPQYTKYISHEIYFYDHHINNLVLVIRNIYITPSFWMNCITWSDNTLTPNITDNDASRVFLL